MVHEQTLVFGKDINAQKAKKQKVNAILAKLGIGLVSAGAGAGAAMLFTSAAAPKAPTAGAATPGAATDSTATTPAAEAPHFDKPEVAAGPKEATTVSDNMDFGHAFHAARTEVGSGGFFVWHGKVYGTQYAEEQSKLSPEEQKEMYGHIMVQFQSNHHITPGNDPHDGSGLADADAHLAEPRIVIIHDEAPHAASITNDMTFRDAFTLARAEVGPGGIFDWHGKHYNTYTREELSDMTQGERHEFMASVGKFEIHNMNANDTNATVSEHDIDIVNVGHNTDVADAHEPVATDHADSVITDKVVTLDDGSSARVVLAEVDGSMVLKIDAENDGVFDMDITPNDDGTFHLQAGGEGMDVTMEEFDMLFGTDLAGNDMHESAHFPLDPEAPHGYEPDTFDLTA